MDGAEDRIACRGCGGAVPDTDGPTHPYLLASPGCWQLYGHWMADLATGSGSDLVPHHVDCYAVQHPEGAEVDRRQRQSIAVHLGALCLRLERDTPSAWAIRVRARALELVPARHGLEDWPLLDPPTGRGATTIVDVAGAGEDIDRVFRRWADDCWTAWHDHHPTVREWADTVAQSL